MTPCIDPEVHEAGWDHQHTGPLYRWHARDGCRGTSCRVCIPPVVAATPVDADDIPLDPRERTMLDQLAVIFRRSQ